jgi:hypothetical protein
MKVGAVLPSEAIELLLPLLERMSVWVVAHYGPQVLHVTMHGVRAFFN